MTVPTQQSTETKPELPECKTCPVNARHGFCPGLVTSHDDSAGYLGERVYPAKTVLYRQGSPVDEILLLHQGWAITFRISPDGRRRIIEFKLPGEPLNTSALFSDYAFSSLQTLTPIQVCAFRRDGLLTRLSSSRFHESTENMVIWSVQALYERVMNLSSRSGLEAIGTLFLDFYTRLKRVNAVEGESYYCPVTQEHIADAFGLTKVHVSRMLGVLRRKQLLELKQQKVTILDYQGLWRLTGFDEALIS